ncbi:MAG: hypothetical protein R2745_03655 [Vicinamibacterales bacterium]
MARPTPPPPSPPDPELARAVANSIDILALAGEILDIADGTLSYARTLAAAVMKGHLVQTDLARFYAASDDASTAVATLRAQHAALTKRMGPRSSS